VTGLINQELLLKNEYRAAENRILRALLPARLRLSDPERSTLAEIGKRLGRKALAQVACVPKPTPFWLGAGSSLPRSSMDPNSAAIPAGRPSSRSCRS
jgi:hypothetical protein